MFGAIYIGLSGLNAYSQGLQQVSNNVTNLNTTGFKGSSVSFQNFYGASGDGSLSLTAGGQSNGHGVSLGDARLDFKQGELRQTDRDLDLAVDGNGFLVLLDGKDTVYSRTGSFEVNDDGFVVLSGTDRRLATLDDQNRPVSVSIDAYRTSVPSATTKVKFSDNLSSSATTYSVGNIKVYDATGGSHVWTAAITKDTTAGAGNWKVTVTDDKGAELGSQALRFLGGVIDPATATLEFTDSAAALTVSLDFSSGVTSYSSGETSTLRAADVDGYAEGTVVALAVNAKGNLELTYSNEQKKELGAVALADFRDPGVLEQRSDGIFVERRQTAREFLTSEDPRVGRVVSKRLEASNVDLSAQFGNLILIQRGFQASSQIVSVSNDMIQQLFGIRGQG